MKEKSEQEQRAAERQVELISDALNSAKDNAGFWMNQGRIMPPRLYPKGPSVSPFNALILGLHTDRNGYKTAHYTFFQDAKARGESVKERERVFLSTGTTGAVMSTVMTRRMSSHAMIT